MWRCIALMWKTDVIAILCEALRIKPCYGCTSELRLVIICRSIIRYGACGTLAAEPSWLYLYTRAQTG